MNHDFFKIVFNEVRINVEFIVSPYFDHEPFSVENTKSHCFSKLERKTMSSFTVFAFPVLFISYFENFERPFHFPQNVTQDPHPPPPTL